MCCITDRPFSAVVPSIGAESLEDEIVSAMATRHIDMLGTEPIDAPPHAPTLAVS